jgi:hypothetical protein
MPRTPGVAELSVVKKSLYAIVRWAVSRDIVIAASDHRAIFLK